MGKSDSGMPEIPVGCSDRQQRGSGGDRSKSDKESERGNACLSAQEKRHLHAHESDHSEQYYHAGEFQFRGQDNSLVDSFLSEPVFLRFYKHSLRCSGTYPFSLETAFDLARWIT